MTPTEDRAEQLLAMTQRLISLVSEEVEAVKVRKLDASGANWEEKERLVHAWRLEVSRIKADPSQLAGIGAERKEALRAASRELEAQLEAHAMALGAARVVTEGLVRSIAQEIAAARSAPQGYGRAGIVTPGQRREASGLAVDAKA
jgi:hypothetical protein